MKNDQGGLGVKVLDDLVESLHLASGIVRRLVLPCSSEVLRRPGTLSERRICSKCLAVSISRIVRAGRVCLF